MLYISLTADHEMFFGENFYSEEEVFINPTYKLMDILKKNGATLTLMTDVCSILKYREVELYEYPKLVDEQLKYAITNGHDVQLHIHPHWISSIYKDGKWEFDGKLYKLHDLGFEEDNEKDITADKVIRDGKNYLESLLKKVDKNYKCIAFRAGGWCLQPEKKLLRALKKNGIHIDTTIYKNGFLKTETHYLNYRNTPNRPNWWIDPELGIDKEANKDARKNIFEVSIGSYYSKPYVYKLKIKNKMIQMKRDDIELRGVSICKKNENKFKRINNKINNFIQAPIMFSFEGQSSGVLEKMVLNYLNKYDCKNDDVFIALICHPKVLYDKDFEEIEIFLKRINELYKEQVKFVSLYEIYKLTF